MRRNRLLAQIRWLFALSLILPLLLTPPEPAAALSALPRPAALSSSPHTAQQIDLVDQIGGQPQAVYVSGSIAYVVLGSRLYVLSMNPNTGFISQIYGSLLSPLLVNINAIYPAGDYVYLTSSTYGLLVVDMVSPGQPALVGQLSLPGQANDVVVQGSYAYIADGTAGVQAVYIGQPDQPVLVNTFAPLAGDSAFALVAIGNYLYIADYNHLLVLNKSNPAQLALSGTSPLTGATDIASVPGETTIYLTSSGGLREFFTSDGSFTHHSTLAAADGSTLAVNNSYIYLLKNGQPGHAVQTVSRSTMAAPVITSFGGTVWRSQERGKGESSKAKACLK